MGLFNSPTERPRGSHRRPEPRQGRWPDWHFGEPTHNEGRPKHYKPRKRHAHLDPHSVPSSYHMDQMIPYGIGFDRIFPRFHPSWLQRVQTPVHRVSAYPLHYRGNSQPPHPGGFRR